MHPPASTSTISSLDTVSAVADAFINNLSGGAACFEHADHHPVFLAHATHDLPDRVEPAQLTGDVAFDVLELFQALLIFALVLDLRGRRGANN